MGLFKAIKTAKTMARAKDAAPEAWNAGEAIATKYIDDFSHQPEDLDAIVNGESNLDFLVMIGRNPEARHRLIMQILQKDILPNVAPGKTEAEIEALCFGFGVMVDTLTTKLAEGVARGSL
ncbi:MAG TPA: hypothetical protein VF944_11585 [Candidatus Bathyarchaeia archaeon]